MRCRGGAQDNFVLLDAKNSASLSYSFGLFGLSGLSRVFSFSGSRNKTNQIDQYQAAWLPTVAPVAMSIVARAVDVRAVKVWLSVDPGATQVEAESHRGIGVEGRDRLHDGG